MTVRDLMYLLSNTNLDAEVKLDVETKWTYESGSAIKVEEQNSIVWISAENLDD